MVWQECITRVLFITCAGKFDSSATTAATLSAAATAASSHCCSARHITGPTLCCCLSASGSRWFDDLNLCCIRCSVKKAADNLERVFITYRKELHLVWRLSCWCIDVQLSTCPLPLDLSVFGNLWLDNTLHWIQLYLSKILSHFKNCKYCYSVWG